MGLVFAGEVVAIQGLTRTNVFLSRERVISDSADTEELLVELRVSTIWKGPAYETIFVTTRRDGGSCGFNFKEGQEYVVYAYAHGFLEGPPTVSYCSRTRSFDQAQEDLKWLGEGLTRDSPYWESSGSMGSPIEIMA